MTDLQSCLGQRVLVSVFDGPPRMACVRGFTPSGQYVWLAAGSTDDENVGWQHVARVKVLEVLGPSTDTMAVLEQRVAAAVELTTASLTT